MKRAKTTQKLYITTEQNGFDMLTRNISRNKYLSKGAKALYIYLNSHNENFNLSAESIARFFNESERTIQREINELKKAGFLTLEKKENNNCYYYKLRTSPKLDQIKSFTNENIIDAFWNRIISLQDIDQLRKKKYISLNQYNEIIDHIYKIVKKDWTKND